MTEIFIINIERFAVYDNLVYSYKITVKLKNNATLIILDEVPIINESIEINKWYNARLKTFFTKQSNSECLNCFDGKVEEIDGVQMFKNAFLSIELPIYSTIPNDNLNKKYCFEEIHLIELSTRDPTV